MKIIITIALLIVSNVFMTFAWYGHLQFQKINFLKSTGLIGIIFISWFIALFEYAFQVPANKLGHLNNGGPFNMYQLKTIQEVISILVFILTNVIIFKDSQLSWNHIIGFALIILGAAFTFKGA
jgi:uncharacterized protein